MERIGFDERVSNEVKYKRECKDIERKWSEARSEYIDSRKNISFLTVYKRINPSNDALNDENLRILDILDYPEDFDISDINSQAKGNMTIKQVMDKYIIPNYSDSRYHVEWEKYTRNKALSPHPMYNPLSVLGRNYRYPILGDRFIVTLSFSENEDYEKWDSFVKDNSHLTRYAYYARECPEYPDDAFSNGHYDKYGRSPNHSPENHRQRSVRNESRMQLDELRDEYNTYGEISDDDVFTGPSINPWDWD